MLLPNDPENYYRQRDLVPPDQHGQLGRAKILITNFHAFKPRKVLEAEQADQADLSGTDFTETPAQMVNRVCRELGNKRNIIVINDEAHHCYRRKPDERRPKRSRARIAREAEKRNEEARVWISGLEAVQRQDRHQADLRPVGDPVLPPRLGLPRRDALSLGRLRLLADRRHRVGNRQGSPGSRRRRFDDGRSADLSRSLAPHP